MKSKETFSINIWSEILKLTNKDGIENVTIKRLENLFNLSNTNARAYKFMLTNFHYINEEKNIQKKLFSVTKENAELRKQIKMMNKEIEESSLREIFKNTLATHKIEKHEIPISTKPGIFNEPVAKIALMSDFHIEEVIEKDVVNDINEYNLKIAKERIERYFSRLCYLLSADIKRGHNIKDFVLAILGDMINGYIHEEFIESNSLSPTEAILLTQDLLISGIKLIYDNFSHIFDSFTIIISRGNHSRTSKRKKYSTGYKNSYEYMLGIAIKKYFNEVPEYSKLKIIVPKSEFCKLEIYDKSWVFSHGDHFNYLGGVGGIMIPFRRWTLYMQNILPADRYIVGHWHTSIALPFGVINGSGIGYSPFAMSKGFQPEPPQQWLLTQDSKRGFICSELIQLIDF